MTAITRSEYELCSFHRAVSVVFQGRRTVLQPKCRYNTRYADLIKSAMRNKFVGVRKINQRVLLKRLGKEDAIASLSIRDFKELLLVANEIGIKYAKRKRPERGVILNDIINKIFPNKED